MGVHLFDQHIEVVRQMWLEVFEAGITTNAYLSEMWSTATDSDGVGGGDGDGDSRGREIELALRYFDEKYRPLRMLMEKTPNRSIVVDSQDVIYTNNEHQLARRSQPTITTTNNNNNTAMATTTEKKPSTCVSFNCSQLDLSVDRDRSKWGGRLCTGYKVEKEEEEEEVEEEQQQQQQQQSVENHGEYSMSDQRFNMCVPQQENPDRHFLTETKYNIWAPTPSQSQKRDVDVVAAPAAAASASAEGDTIPSNRLVDDEVCRREPGDDNLFLNKRRSDFGRRLGKTRIVCTSPESRERNKVRLKRNRNAQEAKQHLEVSLDNFRKHLCASPTSSFEILHSCPNNFEKLKYLRIKERESPMVRLSCAFQQGYYLELLFPGRRIPNTSTTATITNTITTTTTDYLQRLIDLNMSLSYSRQLRQFYKNFRRYRRLLHLNVPLRSILRNISRIREKIESSEREEQFWSTLPTTTMRTFYECYGQWFDLDLYDVYSLFDVVDNYPSGTTDQFLDDKCVRLYECEGHMKAVSWLNCSADKPRYLLVYRTVDYVHCVLAEKKAGIWTYELSFDRDKNRIVNVGIYVCIKSH